MPFRVNWNSVLPFMCAGFLVGVISVVLPLQETIFLGIGIGALTGAIMRYARTLHKSD
jgi:uncharacterized transporter YbjL